MLDQIFFKIINLFLSGESSKEYVLQGLKKLPHNLSDTLLCSTDPSRIFSVLKFLDFLNDQYKNSSNEKINVALVSGRNDPEVFLLGENILLSCLCFEDDQEMWDLTKDWGGYKYKYLHESFDFVFCEQVFEHLADPFRAFQNLNLLLKKGGFLHLSVPGVNGIHGDPFYFYSGFHPRLLEKWAETVSLEIKHCFFWGSPKAAKMYSVCEWYPLVFSGGLNFFIPKFFSLLKQKNIKKAYLYLKVFLTHKIKYPFDDMWSNNFVTPVITVFLGQKL